MITSFLTNIVQINNIVFLTINYLFYYVWNSEELFLGLLGFDHEYGEESINLANSFFAICNALFF